ncbi:hypothetical protein FIBSPDRAFT_88307 [Athelia psychrophila]|uniref:Uncharacterized protein n=1 Tax=Athelia psychrophila TaxID=1759441 RepID=A0A166DYY6_9AGAM|nr:hypothetical protein FIBSPDRAFT_88307 [Fibularhizoctonia sp. CBS 109695]
MSTSEMTASDVDLHKMMSRKGKGLPKTDTRLDYVKDSDIASLCSSQSSATRPSATGPRLCLAILCITACSRSSHRRGASGSGSCS